MIPDAISTYRGIHPTIYVIIRLSCWEAADTGLWETSSACPVAKTGSPDPLIDVEEEN